MALFTAPERNLAQAISDLVYCNPFLPQRINHERLALGDEFDEYQADWNVRSGVEDDHPNVVRLCQKAKQLLGRVEPRLGRGGKVSPSQRQLYEDLALFVLYHQHRRGFDEMIVDSQRRKRFGPRNCSKLFDAFSTQAQRLLVGVGDQPPAPRELAHLFACFFQIRRAFYNTFQFIIGGSAPTIRLRAAVWQSIFTHDLRRYRRSLYKRMSDFTTLVMGPSGTGKELVARAVGMSRYIPFDIQKKTFTEDFAGSFYPLNLSALSPALIESELFGHKRGAFTGATSDRVGWFEVCPPLGTVFLDEIGDLDPAIQVKLLRVIQTRVFTRLGDTQSRDFHGKMIAATNRDLAQQMAEGHYREDFYYRLCSDIIVTPSLQDRLADCRDEMHELTVALADRIVGPDEAQAVALEVQAWIKQSLGRDYPWPGNVRELEQCVRNIVIRKAYHPLLSAQGCTDRDRCEALTAQIRDGTLTADELLNRYCTLTYARTGSYDRAARQLKLDRRTVKNRVDSALLEQLEAP